MRHQKNALKITLATLSLSFSAASVADNLSPDIAPQSTVDTCVAEISDRADYTESTALADGIELVLIGGEVAFRSGAATHAGLGRVPRHRTLSPAGRAVLGPLCMPGMPHPVCAATG